MGFWDEVAELAFYHAGNKYLKWYGDEIEKLGNGYFDLDSDVDRIKERLQYLEEQMTSAEGDVDRLNELYTELDEATTAVAADIQRLVDAAAVGNVSAADVVAKLTPVVQRLQAMGTENAVTPPTDPTTTTDPSNSPQPDSPLVTADPTAPGDEQPVVTTSDTGAPGEEANPPVSPEDDAVSSTDTPASTDSVTPVPADTTATPESDAVTASADNGVSTDNSTNF